MKVVLSPNPYRDRGLRAAQFARRVLERAAGRFARCFIVMGYYIAYQDLSRSKISRETMIANVYYPIFQDGHHWEPPHSGSQWDGLGELPEPAKAFCQQAAAQKLLEYGTYYSEIRPRGTLFDLKGRTWAQVSQAERTAMGAARAARSGSWRTASMSLYAPVRRYFQRMRGSFC